MKGQLAKVLVAAAAISFVGTGCSSATGDLWSTWKMVFADTPDVVLSADEIEAFPYTIQYVQVGKQPRVTSVLGFVDTVAGQREHHWVTRDRETIVTQRGRLKRVTQLSGYSVDAVTNLANDPLSQLAQLLTEQHDRIDGYTQSWQRQVDFRHAGQARTVTVRSTLQVQGATTIARAGSDTPRNVYYVQERGEFVEYQQTFMNEFWVEADGHVVQSRQWGAPGAPALWMSQIKWVGRD